MKPFEVLIRHFWAALLAVTVLNGIIFKRRSRQCVEEDPQLAARCRSFVRGWLIWMNLPWLVMGIGSTVGGIPTIFHYGRPRDGNPYVLAVWISIFVMQIVSFYWIFFCKGAETMAECGVMNPRPSGHLAFFNTPAVIKIAFLLCLAGATIAAITMWTSDIQIPSFPAE